MQESAGIEYKQTFSEKIKMAVIAFLNTDGGELYVGIDDKGKILGLADIDKEMLKCSNSIYNAIKPDATPFVKIAPLTLEGRQVIKITVHRGTRKPYYLSNKGLKPTGVFVRVGSGNLPADSSAIRNLIKESDKDRFDEGVSTMQYLTFQYANECFTDKHVAFGRNEMRTLGFTNAGGQYTNLALLCSEQNPYTIKFSVFQGTDKAVFLDRKELTGSVFEQLDSAMKTFSLHNKTPATISGLARTDHPDYNEQAVREALLNAVIHRDYNFTGSILFNMFDDRLEIMSLGGLVRGLSKEVILRGVSESRNDKLGRVFFRLGYVEAYGTGIPRMFSAYQRTGLQPSIEIFDQAFNIVLPNFNYAKAKWESGLDALSEGEKKIMAYLQTNAPITKELAAGLIDKKPDTAYRLLEKLVAAGYLEARRNGRKAEYSLVGLLSPND
ncbi:MAG: putative DNA binding domain-containing protein [Treponema sp.]|nr:putative DNA binding domain-containing protein [Treponema sp.]